MNIILIVAAVAVAPFIILDVILEKNAKWLYKMFRTGSCLVYGYKGRGKGLIYQKIIAMSKNRKCYCNIDYGKNTIVKPVAFISCYPNTFENFFDGNIVPFDSDWQEGCDFFIDDAGGHLPSFADNLLNKKYPSMPLAFTFSRHFWNARIHCNATHMGRIWLKLREQADWFLCAVGNVIIFPSIFGIYVKTRYYENYDSAEKRILPLRLPSMKLLTTQEVKMTKAQFDATNGVIKERWIHLKPWQLKYDCRYYGRYVKRPNVTQILG